MPLIKLGEEVYGKQKGGSTVAGTQDVEEKGEVGENMVTCSDVDTCLDEDTCSDVAVEDDGHIEASWKGKGQLLKEESKEVIMVWPSDEENAVEATLPPIDMLDDDGATSESSESFASAA